jgi:hypothetical protein
MTITRAVGQTRGCLRNKKLATRIVGWTAVIIAAAFCIAARPAPAVADSPQIMWVNHFDLLSGDPSVVTTSSNSTDSGVGGGLTGLVIESSTTGEVDSFGGNKVVHMALDLPKQTKVTGVRVCYELTNSSSFISQIRLAQVQDPPSSALVLLDDGTDLTDPGPACVNSSKTSIKASNGSLLLSLRVNFGDTSHKIVVRALGLLVK